MLAIEGLSKRYGETTALSGASIAFRAGTIHTVLGENGSGKSTLVKVLSGIVQPDSGTVELDGRAMAFKKPGEAHAAGIATVFQEVLIASDRNVVDNILLGLDGLVRRRIARSQRHQTAQSALDRFARTKVPLDARAGALPLAVQQLIVLARALVRKPRVLVLDEVTAALDFADREAVFSLMRSLTAEGCLIIFITHRMDEVMNLSDTITVLRGGSVVATEPSGVSDAGRLLRMMAPEKAAGGLAHA